LACCNRWVERAKIVGIYSVGFNGLRARVIHGSDIEGLAFSADGKLLAAASKDGTARIVVPESAQLRALISHEGGINALSFSPDGRWVATAGADGTARVWSTDFGAVLKKLCAGPGRNATLSEWRRYIGEIEWQRTCEEWPDDVRAAGIGR
jgi:WD40 repeat protein